MYTIIFKNKARKELLSLPDKVIEVIEVKIDSLIENPLPHGYKKLKGSNNEYRIRVGNYRIVYTINNNILIITVIKISHRKDVYK